MKINDPIFIRKTEKRGYEISGSLEGYGTIRKYGRTEEEAKDKFFTACNSVARGTGLTEKRGQRMAHCSAG
jgi:hypothetical protein